MCFPSNKPNKSCQSMPLAKISATSRRTAGKLDVTHSLSE